MDIIHNSDCQVAGTEKCVALAKMSQSTQVNKGGNAALMRNGNMKGKAGGNSRKVFIVVREVGIDTTRKRVVVEGKPAEFAGGEGSKQWADDDAYWGSVPRFL